MTNLISLDIPTARRRRHIASLTAILFASIVLVVQLLGLSSVFLAAFTTASEAKLAPTLAHFYHLFEYPGFWHATFLGLWIGLAATALAVFIAACVCQPLLLTRQHAHRSSLLVHRLVLAISRLLVAFPHVAFAIGFALLIAPSGSLIRWLSPWLTGFERPPTWNTLQDAYGISLIVGLALKETAFLIITILTIAAQQPLEKQQQTAYSLGYSPAATWWKLVFPALYQQIKLPILIVLSFSVTVVDISLLLGPNTPAPLSVLIWDLLTDSEPTRQAIAPAGAIMLVLMVVLAIFIWRMGEALIAYLHRQWITKGKRQVYGVFSTKFTTLIMWILLVMLIATLVTLVIMAFSWRWSFRDMLPESWQLRLWQRTLTQMLDPLLNSLSFALCSAILTTGFVIVLLECLNLSRLLWLQKTTSLLMLVPLVIPQLTFLYGYQLEMLHWGWDGSYMAVLSGHIIYAMPYVYLVLNAPWAAHNAMQSLQARLLLRSPMRAFIQVKLIQLLPSISFAIALAVAVSIAQYLTTLMLGAGRYPTITTEAVAIGSGGDRRVLAILAMIQCLIPFIGFLLASRWSDKHKRNTGEAPT